MTDQTVWPEPRPEPDVEHGEDPETHLLPNLERLRSLPPETRQELLDLVREWDGPVVERFRARVADLRAGREPS